MSTLETKYAINLLLNADDSIDPSIKQMIAEMLDKGCMTRTIYLPSSDAAEYCGVSRASFNRHIAPLCRPIKWSSRTIRYSVTDLDKVCKAREAAAGSQFAPAQCAP